MFQFYYLLSLLAAGVVFKGLEKMSPPCGILSYLPFHQSLLPLSIKFFYIFPSDKSISPLPSWKNTMLPCIYGIFIVRSAVSIYSLLICLHITQYWTFTLTLPYQIKLRNFKDMFLVIAHCAFTIYFCDKVNLNYW